MSSEEFEHPELTYTCDADQGYTRKKRGKGFIYLDHKGNKINDPKVIQRLKDLVIPPMWQNVWICQSEKGYLQVTGYDDKNRKQYIYHPKWVEYRQTSKYSRVIEFAKHLPSIRRKVNEHLKLPGFPREKVLALIVKILDRYYIRIGNEHYREMNQTYGITTMRRKHLQEDGHELKLHYKAKSGKERNIKIDSEKISQLIRECSALPGYEIFRYQINKTETHAVDSADVNHYIKEISGASFSAKDFRTWGGTVLAVEHYNEAKTMVEKNPRKKLETTLVQLVAKDLGNTVAVCREYYIHPSVMEVLMNGQLPEYEKNRPTKSQLSKSEEIVLGILESKLG